LSTDQITPKLLTLTNDNVIVTSKQAKNYDGYYYRIYREYKASVLYSGTAKSFEYIPHGYGKMYYLLDSENTSLIKKETAYRGFWKYGKYNGFGELCYGDFTDKPVYLYRGFWVNDFANGPGIYYDGDTRLSNKIMYIGNFVNNEFYGQGLYLKEYDSLSKNGKIYSGYWVSNQLGWIDDSFKTRSNNVRIIEYAAGVVKSIYVGEVIVSTDKTLGFYIPCGEGQLTTVDTGATGTTETVKKGNFNTNGQLSGKNVSVKTVVKTSGDNPTKTETVQTGIYKDGKPILVKQSKINDKGKQTFEKAEISALI
jgi:hypothetical protein